MNLDYRNMRHDELDSNIPQGRGMIKWMPFATMPEQYEAIQAMIEAQSLKDIPVLSQDIIEENERIAKLMVGRAVIIRYWSAGQEIMMECTIQSIDQNKKILIVYKNQRVFPIYFYYIYEITKGGNLDNLV